MRTVLKIPGTLWLELVLESARRFFFRKFHMTPLYASDKKKKKVNNTNNDYKVETNRHPPLSSQQESVIYEIIFPLSFFSHNFTFFSWMYNQSHAQISLCENVNSIFKRLLILRELVAFVTLPPSVSTSIDISLWKRFVTNKCFLSVAFSKIRILWCLCEL